MINIVCCGYRSWAINIIKQIKDNPKIAYKYNLGGGYKTSNGWEPLGPTGYYDTFGPELSFAQILQADDPGNIAIAKFTHSGSQIIDWTPEGSMAKSRHIYPEFGARLRASGWRFDGGRGGFVICQ